MKKLTKMFKKLLGRPNIYIFSYLQYFNGRAGHMIPIDRGGKPVEGPRVIRQ